MSLIASLARNVRPMRLPSLASVRQAIVRGTQTIPELNSDPELFLSPQEERFITSLRSGILPNSELLKMLAKKSTFDPAKPTFRPNLLAKLWDTYSEHFVCKLSESETQIDSKELLYLLRFGQNIGAGLNMEMCQSLKSWLIANMNNLEPQPALSFVTVLLAHDSVRQDTELLEFMAKSVGPRLPKIPTKLLIDSLAIWAQNGLKLSQICPETLDLWFAASRAVLDQFDHHDINRVLFSIYQEKVEIPELWKNSFNVRLRRIIVSSAQMGAELLLCLAHFPALCDDKLLIGNFANSTMFRFKAEQKNDAQVYINYLWASSQLDLSKGCSLEFWDSFLGSLRFNMLSYSTPDRIVVLTGLANTPPELLKSINKSWIAQFILPLEKIHNLPDALAVLAATNQLFAYGVRFERQITSNLLRIWFESLSEHDLNATMTGLTGMASFEYHPGHELANQLMDKLAQLNESMDFWQRMDVLKYVLSLTKKEILAPSASFLQSFVAALGDCGEIDTENKALAGIRIFAALKDTVEINSNVADGLFLKWYHMSMEGSEITDQSAWKMFVNLKSISRLGIAPSKLVPDFWQKYFPSFEQRLKGQKIYKLIGMFPDIPDEFRNSYSSDVLNSEQKIE